MKDGYFKEFHYKMCYFTVVLFPTWFHVLQFQDKQLLFNKKYM